MYFAVVKILVFLLAITVLACGIIPCAEVTFTSNDHPSGLVSKSTDHEKQDSGDHCSPFCSCNCCCGITFLYTTYQEADPFTVMVQRIVLDLPSKVFDNSLPVWQPPQLV